VLPSWFRQKYALTIVSSVAVSAFAQSAQAQFSASDYEKLGQKQYSQANFKGAAASFRLALYQGAKSASTWLYLGECYDRTAEVGAARQTYQTIQKYFPGTPECIKATERLTKLPKSGAATAAASTAAPAVSASPAADRKTLKDRIYIVPPQFGHSAVDSATIRLVRNLTATLPASVYKILDQGGTNIYLTPNLIDKWPTVVGTINEHLGVYFCEEHGRTYGREVYLCERVGRGAGTELGPVLSDEVIKEFLYTMLSHALNDCLEMPSKDPQFVAMYKQDYANLDTTDPRLHAFIAPVEGVADTFGALSANIMGSSASVSEYCSRSFPRCRAWIVQRIKILSERGS
jgi:hypothetical protein